MSDARSQSAERSSKAFVIIDDSDVNGCGAIHRSTIAAAAKYGLLPLREEARLVRRERSISATEGARNFVVNARGECSFTVRSMDAQRSTAICLFSAANHMPENFVLALRQLLESLA